MRSLLVQALWAAMSLAMVTSVQAAEGVVHGQPDDFIVLRLGGMYTDSESTLRGNAPAFGFNETREVSYGSFDEKWIPRGEGWLRLANRHHLIFNYLKYDQSDRATLSEAVTIANTQIPAGSFVQGRIEFQIASLAYDFAVIDAERVSLGLQLGAHWAKAKASAQAQIGSLYQGHLLDESVDGFAPVIGARLSFEPIDRLSIHLQGQYLNAKWGDFDDYDGDLKRANAIVEYRFTPNVGAFVGYDWFDLSLDKKWSGGLIGVEQEFKGPIAGVTLAF